MHSTTVVLVLLVIINESTGRSTRNRRSEQIATCSMECEGQWKSEFEINFQKLFDTNYFEVPIDPVILGSLTSLKSFCSSTRQKFQCLKKDCGIKSDIWSPEHFVCVTRYDEFEKNTKCLQQSNSLVQKQCLEACSNLTTHASRHELSYIRELHLSNSEKSVFFEQNQHCHFIGCHQMCHEYVISKTCSQQAARARSLIKEYYDGYLTLEHLSLVDENEEELFSSFCRRITPGLNENLPEFNMTMINNEILEKMRRKIRKVLQPHTN